MKTGFFAFFVMLAIVFSYEVAFGDELSSVSLGSVRESDTSERQTAEKELQVNLTNAESATRATATEDNSVRYNTSAGEGTRRESAAAIKGRY